MLRPCGTQHDTVPYISQNAVNLRWDEVRLPHPAFDGDTIYTQSEVLEMRLSQYRKLAQENHPDKVAGLAAEFRELAEKRMKIINIAYEDLKHTHK